MVPVQRQWSIVTNDCYYRSDTRTRHYSNSFAFAFVSVVSSWTSRYYYW